MLYTIALIIHVLSIVIWIGGVAFVTMIMFPMIQRTKNSLEQVLMFQGVEHRFSKVAKVMVILAGLSGLYLVYEKYGFNFKELGFGVWIMIFVWVFYASLLFFLEPFLFRKLFASEKQPKTEQIFFRLQVFHWFILILSFSAIAAGIWTAHY